LGPLPSGFDPNAGFNVAVWKNPDSII